MTQWPAGVDGSTAWYPNSAHHMLTLKFDKQRNPVQCHYACSTALSSMLAARPAYLWALRMLQVPLLVRVLVLQPCPA